ncbi:xanthine dehydrogenase family protein subunit M [Telmatospirillum sp. J64-1]|uniref:FAD binding domain-containing protein n=1 Tax=Telmatospirillum sp. J64-1 TaxID=2502183 RepID=UPI00115F10BA|nr:FAD binding domain-containing protein [Telmatospirillum sp. J64-1]
MKLPSFEYACPATLAEAVRILADHEGEAKVISGGQSLMPVLAFRLAAPSVLVDLRNVPGLDRITITENGVHLGARVRWCDIESHDGLRKAHPLLVQGISHVAHYQIRNRGTVGGSLAHADPAAEMPGLAVACDAEISVQGVAGSRLIKAADFFDGALSTVLEFDEIITGIRFPAWPSGRRWAFEEFARRRGDFAMAGVALHFDLDAAGRACNAHVGVIGVCSHPCRLTAVEEVINGNVVEEDLVAAAAKAASEAVAADVTGDMHASAEYRQALIGVLVERALAHAQV